MSLIYIAYNINKCTHIYLYLLQPFQFITYPAWLGKASTHAWERYLIFIFVDIKFLAVVFAVCKLCYMIATIVACWVYELQENTCYRWLIDYKWVPFWSGSTFGFKFVIYVLANWTGTGLISSYRRARQQQNQFIKCICHVLFMSNG